MAGMYPDNQQLTLFGEPIEWPGLNAKGKFTNGSFDNPLEKPSFIPAETLNLILDNLSELIKKFGGDPNTTSITQLADLFNLAGQGSQGLVKTVNGTPNNEDVIYNEPWAASPNWVCNLITGKASGQVNDMVKKALTTILGIQALQQKIKNHTQNKKNPHVVTKAQVGLGNLPNKTSDSPDYNSSTCLATSKAVKAVYDRGITSKLIGEKTAYVKFGGEFIIQWGVARSTKDGNENFLFPTSFKTKTYSIITSREQAGAADVLPVAEKNKTFFTINRSDYIDGTQFFSFIAFGK